MAARRSPLLWPVLTVLIVATAALSPSLFLGKIPAQTDWHQKFMPWRIDPPPARHNPSGGDSFFVYLPDRLAAVRELESGRLPLWNPHVAGGVPFLGMQTANPLDPAILLLLILPTGPALGIHYAGLLILAGLGMVLYLRDRGIRSPPALALGAVAFMLCPYFTTWLESRVFLAGLAGTPLALWAMERVLTAVDRRRSAAILALTLGYAAVAGSLQTLGLVVLLLLARAIAVAAPRLRGEASAGILGSGGVWFLLAVTVGLATAALPILAGLELIGQSGRLQGEGYYAQTNYLHWRALAMWFNPLAYGWPAEGAPPLAPIYGRSFAGSSGWGSLGVVPLFLAMLALLARSGPAAIRRFWAGIAGLTLLALVVMATPAAAAIRAAWPGVDHIDLLRGLFVVNLAGAILAAIGMDRLLRDGTGSLPRVLAAALGVAGIGLILAGRSGLTPSNSLLQGVVPALVVSGALLLIVVLPVSRSLRAWALIGLTLVELGRFHVRFNTFADPGSAYPMTSMLEAFPSFQGPPGYSRMMVYGRISSLPPNVPSVFGLSDIRGYTNLPVARYRTLLECAEGTSWKNQTTLQNLPSPVYRLLGGAQVFALADFEHPGFRPVMPGKIVTFFRREDVLPRAFLVHEVVPVQGEGPMRAALSDPGLDPARAALLDVSDRPAPPIAPAVAPESVVVSRLEPTRVTVEVDASADAVLVLADTFYPGWRATVDGVRTEILPVYHALRGVSVPAGRHVVEFRYAPSWLVPGAGLTGLGLLVALLGLIPVRRRGRSS